jgi:preprotein translocase subunit SecF
MQIFTNANYDFVRWRWHAIAVSLVLIAAGIAVTAMTRGLPMGVDFEGGTIVIVRFEQMPQIQQVRAALSAGMPGGGEAVVQQYGPAENRDVMIRVRRTGEEIEGQLSAEADAVIAALRAGDLGNFEVEGTEIVGPSSASSCGARARSPRCSR